MKQRLEQIRELTSPFENRIKSVETNNILKKVAYDLLGDTVCIIRGALMGYAIGSLASGFNQKYAIAGAAIGASIDIAQSTIREFDLFITKNENPQFYLDNIRSHKKALKINYGRYAE